ncbi:winged helix-turn-helix transcriptional regulator [Roseospira marina]|uniref:Winged helix-turn-helix transcriptional regulator n=1 Tax=Roseospira marina TaxID=140057 RepID=A0A5M6IE29_9PROT|nr:winged helix-turn-helix domain-containing protein [Roseospira marina]KAA5605838.1 winged helix-turn-helix transcriptional regulator [Roseospira marina]MBB4313657.1 DNA-binding response OmpR family regulator [Roseospira marina]MBB5086819.1 DNA-binding response OmpR family regulator [Roseospira marina]
MRRKQGSPGTQEPCARETQEPGARGAHERVGAPATEATLDVAPDSLRLVLIDPLDAPRKALAGQLATHLGAAVLTESPTVEAALDTLDPDTPPHWDAVLVSVSDDHAARAAIVRLRDRQSDLPILLMLASGRTQGGSWPSGVTAVTRPVRLATLAAALKALVAERTPADRGTFDLGPFRCDPAGRTLVDRAGGRTLSLTEKEAAILECLHAAAASVSRDALMATVWDYASGVTSHTLETHIHRLRRKIEADPRQPTLLLKDSTGYRLRG